MFIKNRSTGVAHIAKSPQSVNQLMTCLYKKNYFHRGAMLSSLLDQPYRGVCI